MNTIATKYGTFNVTDNGNGGVALYLGEKKVFDHNEIAWWNTDAILTALDKNKEVVLKKISEGETNILDNINLTNAVDVMERLVDVFGNSEKGFYASRLKQCINKMKSDNEEMV